ncbi:cuticle protein 10.9-like [Dermacentor albipictus]|uniref:cuticle protein 10.9-like n=1 Tax=Dermacentor albipictus TaxID=60249 RepID=UPI0038FCBA49
MTSVALLACLFSCVFAEQRYSDPGYFYDSFQGPLLAAAATPGVASAEPVYPPQPYSFGYDNLDEYGSRSYRNEKSDANNVKTGSYGYRDANGIYRRVTYIADANGYRATIDTNEPGTAPGSSADAVFNARPIRVAAGAKSASAPVPVYVAPAPYGVSHNRYGARNPWFS